MATRKRQSSSGRKTKKERMQEMERAEEFRREIILWVIVAVSLLLFISNLGIGGKVDISSEVDPEMKMRTRMRISHSCW